MQTRFLKILIFAPLVAILIGAAVQQMRYPHSAAWIVLLLGAGYLLLAIVVRRATRSANRE